MNSIVISGRFTDNPESKGTQDKAIAHFNLADNYGQDKVSFFRCSAFGKTAELILNSCQKGHKLVVSGRMEEQQWTDNNNQKQRAWQCNISTIDFIEPKGSTPQSAPPAQSAQQQYNQPGYQPPAAAGPQYAQPPSAPAAAELKYDTNGNGWQVINGQWQMVKPAVSAAPPFPPASATPFPTNSSPY